jgi:hypothetical protein
VRKKELILISVGSTFGGQFSLVSTQFLCFLNAFDEFTQEITWKKIRFS